MLSTVYHDKKKTPLQVHNLVFGNLLRKCGRIYCAEHLPYKMSLPISGEEKEVMVCTQNSSANTKVCKECYFEKPVYYREPSEEEESEETKRHKEMQRIQQENKEKKEEAEHKKKEREAEEKKAFREFAKAIEAGDLETMRDVIVAGIIDCNYSDDTGKQFCEHC